MKCTEMRTLISFSMSRILVRISSVLKDMTSSGMSAQVSSAGWSGVTSMAPSWGAAGAEFDESDSGCFSGLGAGFPGGGADDIM